MSDDPIERGLTEAFGHRSTPGSPTTPSVLAALRARTGSRLDLHLDSRGLDDAPVRVTDEARALRDPSGRYQVLGEIGRGGVGVVYKGRDTDLGRDVAMKVLKDEYASRPDVLERFVEEAQIGGQLQHPGIVPVYELGLQAGERPYFAMKLVKGETLAEELARRTDPAQDRRRLLGVFEQVCQTVAYAHARRVVHRDLKPANVMIGAFGEVQVVDWGFAKVLAKGGAPGAPAATDAASERSVIETVRSESGSGSASLPGSMLGTPAYMPPEQARGDVAHVDRRSDVFALGAILCELLTGEPPYREADGDLVRQAAGAELEGAHERLARCGADPALVALCTACLTPAPRARPESAAEVAERVGAWLTSVEERARRAELRAAEARYRHRTTLVGAVAALVVLALGTGTWAWLESQARERRAEAVQLVSGALSAASGARGKAQAAGLDVALWDAAVVAARQAVELAESDEVTADARDEADDLLAAVDAEREAARAEANRLARDAEMLARLEMLRIPLDENVHRREWITREARRLGAEYAAAFAAYSGGASLLELPLEDALANLRSGDIELELATSLDHWALTRDTRSAVDDVDAAETTRLRELAARLDPGNPWRTELRALLPRVEEEGERLRAMAEEADYDSLTAAACRVLGIALWRAGEAEASVSALGRAQEAHPTDFDLCFLHALHLEYLDELEEAVAGYRVAHALRPEHAQVQHRLTVVLVELGRYGDAERFARYLVEADPSKAHWLRHVGEALWRQRRFDEALEALHGALALDPRDSVTHQYLGMTHDEQGRLDEAIEAHRRAVELDPRNAAAHTNLGNSLSEAGRTSEAIAHLEKAVELEGSALHLANLGFVLETIGERDAAMERFRAALDLDDGEATAHRGIGLLYWRLGDLERAIEHCRRAVELAPDEERALNDMGVVLKDHGDVRESIPYFERSLELDPDDAGVLENLGTAWLALGELDPAMESLGRALQLGPSAGIHNNLGLVRKARGELDRAAEHFTAAMDLDEEHAPAYVNLGRVHRARGRDREAIEAFQRAAELFDEGATTGWSAAFARQWGAYARNQIEGIRRTPELEDVLAGRRPATSSAEWAQAVDHAYTRGRFAEIVALTEETLSTEPELLGPESWRTYNSACAAVRLAADARLEPDPAERARVRALAHAWLSSEVERWRAWLASGERETDARQRLTRTLQDSDFASVRGEALEELTPEERSSWSALWDEIERAAGGDAE